MKRTPIALVVLVGLFVASTATAFLMMGKPSGPVVLPDSAFTKDTMMAMVMDFQQADAQTQQTFKDTIGDFAEFFGESFGEPVPTEMLDEVYAGMDRFFDALVSQRIQAVGMTMEMDFNELIRNRGEGPEPEPRMTMLVKAGKQPDLVAIAAAMLGEEVPVEVAEGMAGSVLFESLGDGWYAISPDIPDDVIRVPAAGDGDAAASAKFNEAMGHAAGGLVQVAMVLPEDTLNAMAGVMAAELPEGTPEPLREMIRAITDLKSASYAIDVNKGMGVRYAVVYDNEESAARTLAAYKEVVADMPGFMDAMMAANPMLGEDERAEVEAMMEMIQPQMDEMMELFTFTQEGATIKAGLDEKDFERFLEIYMEMIQAAMDSAMNGGGF